MDYVGVAIDHNHLMQAQDEARALMRAYRHLGPKDDDTFGMVTSDALVNLWDSADERHLGDGGRRGLRIHGGRRRRDHEHHAGGGQRAHARDRHSQIGRRAAAGHPESVPGGVVDAGGNRRIDGRDFCWIVAVLVRSLTPVPMAVPLSAVFIGVMSFGGGRICSSASTPRNGLRGWIRLKR